MSIIACARLECALFVLCCVAVLAWECWRARRRRNRRHQVREFGFGIRPSQLRLEISAPAALPGDFVVRMTDFKRRRSLRRG